VSKIRLYASSSGSQEQPICLYEAYYDNRVGSATAFHVLQGDHLVTRPKPGHLTLLKLKPIYRPKSVHEPLCPVCETCWKLNLTAYFLYDIKSLRIEENLKTITREHQCFPMTKIVKTS
jgi:hypothetical protein